MRATLDLLYKSCGVLAAISLSGIAVLILAQIIGRFFGVLVPSANEIAGFLMAASSFLALAYVFRAGSHIRVTMLLLRKAHLGEVSVTVWPKELKEICAKKNIHVLE